MSLEENKAVVRRYQEIYNSNNLAPLGEVLSPDFKPHNLMGGIPAGLEGYQMLHQSSVASYPDFKVNIEDLLADGDKVIMRFVITGTHTGTPFMGIPPAGVKIHVTGISIFRLADGKIVEHWGEEDSLGWMTQLGALKS